MSRLSRIALSALLAVAAAAPLAAQEIKPLPSSGRAGFWWGLGLGAALTDVTCDGCPSLDPESFPMFDVRLGGTLSRSTTFGIQVAGGRRSGVFGDPPSVDHTVGDVNASVYYYPRGGRSFWLQGGLSALVWQGSDGSLTLHSTAGGVTLGVGYDVPIGPGRSIAPFLRAAVGGKADVVDEDGNRADLKWRTEFLELGAAIVWH